MQILTIAVGLILVYLILSMITSAINEAIAGWLAFRGKFLIRGIENMLDNQEVGKKLDQAAKTFSNNFMAHAHCKSIMTGKDHKRQPSYIKPDTFSTIILDLLNGEAESGIQQAINDLRPGKLQAMLQKLWTEAEHDLAQFKQQLENWYQEVMDRVSGEYKRFANMIICVLGFLVAVYFNADSLNMYHKMTMSSNSAAQSEQVLQLAQNLLEPSGAPKLLGQLNTTRSTIDTATSTADSLVTFQLDSLLLQQNLATIQEAQAFITELNQNNSPLGIGWTQAEWTALKQGGFLAWFNKLLGFFITTMAISLGAPFWFDLLKKIMNVRHAGK